MKIIRRNIKIILLLILVIIIIAIVILKTKLIKEKDVITTNDIVIEKKDNDIKEEDTKICTVDIKGAIKLPGVYKSECNKYVNDIILLAGGLKDDADTTYINLAKKINDQMVIVIYTKDDIVNLTKEEDDKYECVCPEIKNNACIDNKNDEDINNELININTADMQELMKITGIGEVRAKAIIEYRSNFGPFKSINDILKVNGIGESLYEQIKIYITT